MIIWGVDPSSKCGLAIWDNTRDISSAHCEVIENKVKRDYYWFAVQVGRTLRNRVKEFGKPDLVVIEQGSESTQGTGINGIIWGWDCAGAIAGIMGVYGMPIATIWPSTWRTPFYGRGFIPPQIPVMEKGVQVINPKTGKPKFENDWKTAAINKCSELGVQLPPQKGLAHNAAEAVAIAHSWAHATHIHESYEDAFKRLKKARNERPASADLFGGVAA